jgi:amicyanin
MKKTKKVLVSLAIAGMALSMIPFNAFADTGVTTARLFGSDRVGTAVAVADEGWTTANTAILAPAADANLVDALAAAPLAGKTDPILLTDNNTLTDATKDELIKLGVGNVYVVGAINQTVIDQVNAMTGVTATVLKGDDRIGTAAAISAKLTNPAGSFVVGYGALADALSVASYAAANNYSILVANPDGSLPDSEAQFKGSNVYIIGGPTLVADIPGATRLFGADRFATNKAVLGALTYKYDKAYVANGTDAHLVDSLVASSLAAMSGAPIVLSDTNGSAAAAEIHAKLAANAVVTALGSASVVPDAVRNEVATGVVLSPTTNVQNISIKGFAFSPPEITINQGDTVTWTNEDMVMHNVVGGILHSEDLANGQSFSFTFTETGTYDYICTHHPSMKGSIIVK